MKYIRLFSTAGVRNSLVLALILASCGSAVQFERTLGTGRYPAMPASAPIAMAEDVDALPQPAVILGELRLRSTRTTTQQGRAEELLLDIAGSYGCDAIAAVVEERVDVAGKKTATPDEDKEFQWVAKCVRTAKAEMIALATTPGRHRQAPPVAPQVSAAEREQRKLVAEADKARKEAERAAAVASDKERKAKAAAETADKERHRLEKSEKGKDEAERKRREAEEEIRKREADQAERDRKRKEAEVEERAKRDEEDKARREAETAEKERKRKETQADQARRDAEEKARKYTELNEKDRKKKEAAAEKSRKDAEATAEKDRKKREEQAQKSANADAKKSEEQGKKFAEDRAKRDAEDKAKREADERAKRDGEDRARRETEERAKREAEDKAKREAEEKVRRETEEKGKREAEERAKREAEDKARAASEEKSRKEAESAAKKAGKDAKGAGKAVDWKVRFDQAQAEDSEAAWLDLLGTMPDGEDNDRAFEKLQRVARNRSGAWLTTETPKIAAEESETAALGDPNQLKRELTDAGATMARFLAPKEYTQAWTLRNPTKQPVVIDLRTPTGRIVKFLEATATASGVIRGPCPPLGPPLRSKVGLVLEYRFGCDIAKVVPRLGLVRPAKRDLGVDRRASDPDPSLETIAKLWGANPGTRLADVHLLAVEEAMRRRGDEGNNITGKIHMLDRSSAAGPVPVRVELRNNSHRDLTVVFEVGTGREERSTVGHKSTESIKFELASGQTPELKIKATVPKLRSLDWLVGLWSFQGLALVVLPGPSGLLAWTVEPAAGDDAIPKLHGFAVRQNGSDIVFEAEPPGLVALSLFADKTPAACDKRCTVAIRVKLSDQDRYVAGAGRVLLVAVEIPGRTGTFEFSADH
ncbi:MAG: hypothetical protein EXR77_10315 [Myxococcales bacterium]|nr:hypothetical protein [Myxococcales bacterium]